MAMDGCPLLVHSSSSSSWIDYAYCSPSDIAYSSLLTSLFIVTEPLSDEEEKEEDVDMKEIVKNEIADEKNNPTLESEWTGEDELARVQKLVSSLVPSAKSALQIAAEYLTLGKLGK